MSGRTTNVAIAILTIYDGQLKHTQECYDKCFDLAVNKYGLSKGQASDCVRIIANEL